MKFEIAGDFDDDRRPDKAVVGVYETATGAGRFLLIVTESRASIWKPTFLEVYPGDPGFLGLKQNGSKLELWSCMECGNVSNLVWSRQAQKYVWLRAPKYD